MDPFMGEIRLMSFNFAPKGWAMCNGQLLPINQNQALFSLLGTMYGGDGRVNFALPDLRGRIPMHFGSGFTQGQAGGEQAHTVTVPEMPQHTHVASGTSASGNTPLPNGALLGNANLNAYAAQTAPQPILPSTVGNAGGSQPHQNMSPYTVLVACIALSGLFPSRN